MATRTVWGWESNLLMAAMRERKMAAFRESKGDYIYIHAGILLYDIVNTGRTVSIDDENRTLTTKKRTLKISEMVRIIWKNKNTLCIETSELNKQVVLFIPEAADIKYLRDILQALNPGIHYSF